MLITLPCRTVIRQLVTEDWLICVAPLGAVSHRFNLYTVYTVQHAKLWFSIF